MRTDRQTDKTKLIVAIRSFPNAPKNNFSMDLCLLLLSLQIMKPILLCPLHDRILFPQPDCRYIFLCPRFGQKINLQFIYFPFVTFSSHKGD